MKMFDERENNLTFLNKQIERTFVWLLVSTMAMLSAKGRICKKFRNKSKE